MGAAVARPTARQSRTQEALLVAFAQRLRERYDARVYLFGSRARGSATAASDYDLVAVAEAFARQHPLDRAPDRRELWREAGGWGIPLDLHCYSPDEFRRQLAGLGYLATAKVRGELREIRTARPTASRSTGARPRMPRPPRRPSRAT